jgi:hypothetical protein
MGQNRNRDQDSPRQSTMEPAEGSRDNVQNSQSQDRSSSADQGASGNRDSAAQRNSGASNERGAGSGNERNSGGGITNRGLDREMEEQEQLPDRGHSQSER